MAFILVVEDDNDTREFFETLLQTDGHECGGCKDAEEARALILSVRPDLVLMDINLPGESGVALCWELHQLDPRLPVVVTSAVLEFWDLDDIRDCGAAAVLDKARPIGELIHTVDQFCHI